MSISGVLGRFFAVYVVLMIAASLALRFFGATSISGVNVGILIGAVMWPCVAFGTKNKRYFTAPEKSKVVWGMIVINLLLQAVFGGAALAAEGKLSVGALAFALLFVGVLHSLAITYFVGMAGKNVEKLFQKQAAGG
jgi:hypothetical protein